MRDDWQHTRHSKNFQARLKTRKTQIDETHGKHPEDRDRDRNCMCEGERLMCSVNMYIRVQTKYDSINKSQAMFSWDTKSKSVNLLVNPKANKEAQQVNANSMFSLINKASWPNGERLIWQTSNCGLLSLTKIKPNTYTNHSWKKQIEKLQNRKANEENENENDKSKS